MKAADYGADDATAKRFLSAVAKRLGLDPDFVFTAYEDAFYYLWRERRFPANVDPFNSKLEDPLERARLAKVFSQGLDKPVGHVLLSVATCPAPAGKAARGSCGRSGVT